MAEKNMIPKPLQWIWIVCCLLASAGSAIGAFFIIRAGNLLAALPCFMLCAGFGFWAWWEIRRTTSS